MSRSFSFLMALVMMPTMGMSGRAGKRAADSVRDEF
jgi:hypothetical protein